jgi:DNA-binding IclR family transcriptional regulator
MGASDAVETLSQPPSPYSYEHEGDRQFATTLARGLEVLRCFTPPEPMLGNKEISVRTGLPKPTVSRLTYTLTKLGYLRHNMRLGKYQLGSAVLSIGYPLLASMSIRQIARPFMRELADYANGSVNMAIRDRLNMVYVEACRSGNLTTLPDIGSTIPLARTVTGRAYLFACTPPEREAILNQMKVKEPETLKKNQAAIAKSLEDVRAKGYCISYGDLRQEIHAVGVPMRRTVDGEIITFNCGVPAFMAKKGQLEEDLGPRLVAMVRNIEAAIGIH